MLMKISQNRVSLQSVIDFAGSVILLISGLTLQDTSKVHSHGILGELECRLWNSGFLLWALFCASTWNIVAMTIERYVYLNLELSWETKS